MSDTAYVPELPECDTHKYILNQPGIKAVYDGKTIHGPWANMCANCFGVYGIGLGTGKGQKLIVR